jgi:putative ATPase
LPHVEDGTVYFIGATTENPSFALNNALLSRARVYVLNPLTEDDLIEVLNQALTDTERGLGLSNVQMELGIKQQFARAADGDARRLLNLLEIAVELANAKYSDCINETIAAEVLSGGVRRFDNQGEEFYNQISALHKSIRGSNPDAALYWFCRMLDGGCDPRYIARRVLRIASEDIGNADPRALPLCLAACDVMNG